MGGAERPGDRATDRVAVVVPSPGVAVIRLQTGRRVGGLRGEPKMNGLEMGANRHRMEGRRDRNGGGGLAEEQGAESWELGCRTERGSDE